MGFFRRHPVLLMGLAVTAAFLWMAYVHVGFIDTLEYTFYDLRMGLTAEPDAPSDIVLVDIDDDSLEKLGRWPWPRSILARGLEKIEAGTPRLVGLNVLFTEPEESSGLKVLAELERLFAAQGLDQGEGAKAFLQAMRQMEQSLDSDAILAAAVQEAGNVVLPAIFVPSVALEGALPPEEALTQFSLPNVVETPEATYPRAGEILAPLPALLAGAAGLGHISLGTDPDGVARRERLIFGYRGLFIPSYALELARLYLNVPREQTGARLGESLQLGSITIPLTMTSEFLVSFKGPRGSFKNYSFFDVLNDKIPLEVFKNKIVLISVSAAGVINPLATPVDPHMPLGEYSAHTLWSLLHQKFIEKPYWNRILELSAVLFVGLVIIVVLPRIRALYAFVTFIALMAAMLGGATWAFAAKGIWVTTAYPVLQLLVGYLGVVSLQYFVTESDKEKVEEESAESNRMLGLSFQEQGRLDLAFDKFRRCPVDKGMKDILYSLAQDYERKRQYHKAVAVYEHLEAHDPKYKDIKTRKSRLIQTGETVVLGGGTQDPLLSTSTDTRPTLGRYEVLKQLGKGAMGIVYLGKDPRINRPTAIKTFQFPEELDPDETQQLKKRFFQEAESAGTLTHPNIVTIYDAGEEQDLAYIAMEFLEGHDLTRYVKPDSLLEPARAVNFAADLADALDYAHQKGIVHRDIKPANVMLLDKGGVKLTDFGIARITATSQTQTGVVKGTPHYMSPEQISGQKVDGRSDIFSLGVMLYQLLTGRTPFSGENMAALMHQIMNAPHPDPRKFAPRLPKALVQILDKALQKDREQRYQAAAEMSRHLRMVAQKMTAAPRQGGSQDNDRIRAQTPGEESSQKKGRKSGHTNGETVDG